MSDRPLIGSFRSKPGNTPRGKPSNPTADRAERPASEPSETPVEMRDAPGSLIQTDRESPQSDQAAEPTRAGQVPETRAEDLSPAERYRKRLADAKIPLDTALAIYDAVLEKGFYEEYVRIRTKRAVFRTRQYADQLRLQTALEALGPRTALGHDELVSRYNLAASLYEWNGEPLAHEADADHDAILKLIERMPHPVVALLYDALARFDYRVMLVFSEGATDSF